MDDVEVIEMKMTRDELLAELIEHISKSEHPGEEWFQVNDVVAETGLKRETVRNTLQRKVKQGTVERLEIGRKVYYKKRMAEE